MKKQPEHIQTILSSARYEVKGLILILLNEGFSFVLSLVIVQIDSEISINILDMPSRSALLAAGEVLS